MHEGLSIGTSGNGPWEKWSVCGRGGSGGHGRKTQTSYYLLFMNFLDLLPSMLPILVIYVQENPLAAPGSS